MKDVAVDANARQRPILLDMFAKLKVKVETVDIPVPFAAAFEGERVRRV